MTLTIVDPVSEAHTAASAAGPTTSIGDREFTSSSGFASGSDFTSADDFSFSAEIITPFEIGVGAVDSDSLAVSGFQVDATVFEQAILSTSRNLPPAVKTILQAGHDDGVLTESDRLTTPVQAGAEPEPPPPLVSTAPAPEGVGGQGSSAELPLAQDTPDQPLPVAGPGHDSNAAGTTETGQVNPDVTIPAMTRSQLSSPVVPEFGPLDHALDFSILTDMSNIKNATRREEEAKVAADLFQEQAAVAGLRFDESQLTAYQAREDGDPELIYAATLELKESAVELMSTTEQAILAFDNYVCAAWAKGQCVQRARGAIYAQDTQSDAQREATQGDVLYGTRYITVVDGEVRFPVIPSVVADTLVSGVPAADFRCYFNPTGRAGTCGNNTFTVIENLHGRQTSAVEELDIRVTGKSYSEWEQARPPAVPDLTQFRRKGRLLEGVSLPERPTATPPVGPGLGAVAKKEFMWQLGPTFSLQGIEDVIPLMEDLPDHTGIITMTIDGVGHAFPVFRVDDQVGFINYGGTGPLSSLTNWTYTSVWVLRDGSSATIAAPPVGEHAEQERMTFDTALPPPSDDPRLEPVANQYSVPGVVDSSASSVDGVSPVPEGGGGMTSGAGGRVGPEELLVNRDEPAWSSVSPPVEVSEVQVEGFPGSVGELGMWQEGGVSLAAPDGWSDFPQSPGPAGDVVGLTNVFTTPLGREEVQAPAPVPAPDVAAADNQWATFDEEFTKRQNQWNAELEAQRVDFETKAASVKIALDPLTMPGELSAQFAAAQARSDRDIRAADAAFDRQLSIANAAFLQQFEAANAGSSAFSAMVTRDVADVFTDAQAAAQRHVVTPVPAPRTAPAGDMATQTPPTGSQEKGNPLTRAVSDLTRTVVAQKEEWEATPASVVAITTDPTGQSLTPKTITVRLNGGHESTYDGSTGERVAGNGPPSLDPYFLWNLYRETYNPNRSPFVFGNPGAGSAPALPRFFQWNPGTH